jgi:hypothetical protein
MKTKEIPDYGEQGRRQSQTDSDNKIAGLVFTGIGICFILGVCYLLVSKFIIPIL